MKKTRTKNERACKSPESWAGTVAEIVREYLLPLVNDADLEGPFDEAAEIQQPDGVAVSALKIPIPGDTGEYLRLKRELPFSAEENEFVNRFTGKLNKHMMEQRALRHMLLCGVIEEIISSQICPDHAGTVYQVLQVYSQWAAETYEGRRTSHTTGIYFHKHGTGRETFLQLRNSAALKVLGTTQDTLLALARDGSVLGVEPVSGKMNNYKKHQDILAPVEMTDIALWTTSASKIAVRLMPSGEILIFRDKQLMYAKRRSYWRSFPNRAQWKEHYAMSETREEEQVWRSVYLTVLDLAFSGRGGCLGIINHACANEEMKALATPEVLLSSDMPAPTAGLLATIVNGRSFFAIPRRIRTELCAIDGALVIDSHGSVLTAGAILRTNGTPRRGGGRSAAAQALGRGGYGVKISSDGYIEIHRGGRPPVIFA